MNDLIVDINRNVVSGGILAMTCVNVTPSPHRRHESERTCEDYEEYINDTT